MTCWAVEKIKDYENENKKLKSRLNFHKRKYNDIWHKYVLLKNNDDKNLFLLKKRFKIQKRNYANLYKKYIKCKETVKKERKIQNIFFDTIEKYESKNNELLVLVKSYKNFYEKMKIEYFLEFFFIKKEIDKILTKIFITDVCSICRCNPSINTKCILFKCKHWLCDNCFLELIESSKIRQIYPTCPLCRENIKFLKIFRCIKNDDVS